MATLKAEVFGIARPAWHADMARTAALAGAVAVPTFVPKSGVKIETDPKALKAAAESGGDDEVRGIPISFFSFLPFFRASGHSDRSRWLI